MSKLGKVEQDATAKQKIQHVLRTIVLTKKLT